MVGRGAEKIAVAKQAYTDHGYRPILVRLVTDEPERVEWIPSLRRKPYQIMLEGNPIPFKKC